MAVLEVDGYKEPPISNLRFTSFLPSSPLYTSDSIWVLVYICKLTIMRPDRPTQEEVTELEKSSNKLSLFIVSPSLIAPYVV